MQQKLASCGVYSVIVNHWSKCSGHISGGRSKYDYIVGTKYEQSLENYLSVISVNLVEPVLKHNIENMNRFI